LDRYGQVTPTESLSLTGFGLPHALVEALGAAMQRIGTVVERHLITLAVELERTAGQAIAEAANGRAKNAVPR